MYDDDEEEFPLVRYKVTFVVEIETSECDADYLARQKIYMGPFSRLRVPSTVEVLEVLDKKP